MSIIATTAAAIPYDPRRTPGSSRGGTAAAGQVFWRGSPIDEQTRKRTGYMPEDSG